MQTADALMNSQAPAPPQLGHDGASDDIDIDRIVWDLEYREEVRRRLSHSG